MSSTIEKYTQPSAYFPDFDHGSCLLAATSSGGLLLVILILILLARSCRGIVGVPRKEWERRKGMVAGVEIFKLYRRIILGGLSAVFQRLSFESVLRLRESLVGDWYWRAEQWASEVRECWLV